MCVHIFMYVCMLCVCVYVCMYVCMYVCVCMYACMYVHIHVRTYICMYAFMHVYVCIQYVCMHVCMCMYACMYASTDCTLSCIRARTRSKYVTLTVRTHATSLTRRQHAVPAMHEHIHYNLYTPNLGISFRSISVSAHTEKSIHRYKGNVTRVTF
jgi:hypothetical protein